MKLCDNLQKLRKEHHMSQEQLAEKLNVSRQAVSKWESNQTYPEMDKIIAMTKIFDCTMDELVNADEIKKKDKDIKRKSVLEYKDDVFDFIRNSVQRLEKMSGTEILKCIIFLFFIILILMLGKIPVDYVKDLGTNLFMNFPEGINIFFKSIWEIIIDLVYLIIAIIAFIYIFKVKYLDNYNNIEEIEVSSNSDENKNKKEDKIENCNKTIKTIKKEENNNYHSMSFLEFLTKLVLYFIKFMAIVMSVPFIFSLLFLFIGLAISVILLFKKVFYLGILLSLVSVVSLNIIFLAIIFNFVLNGKQNLKVTFITIIASIGLLGVGIGVTSLDVAESTYINEAPKEYKMSKDVYEYNISDKMLINTHYLDNSITYVEDETITDKIKLEVKYYKNFYQYSIEERDNMLDFHGTNQTITIKDISKALIKDLQNKEFHDYSKLYKLDIVVTTSKENIKKIKEAENEYLINIRKMEEQDYVNELNYEISRNEERLEELIEENEELKSKNQEIRDEYEGKIAEYREKIAQYKENLDLLD